MADTAYTAEETADYLHMLDDRIEALEARLPKGRIDDPVVPGWLTINEAAKLARVSRRTIYNWIAGGKVQFRKAPSGTNRVFADSLLPSQVEQKCDSVKAVEFGMTVPPST